MNELNFENLYIDRQKFAGGGEGSKTYPTVREVYRPIPETQCSVSGTFYVVPDSHHIILRTDSADTKIASFLHRDPIYEANDERESPISTESKKDG
jgi:hypothetical protein